MVHRAEQTEFLKSFTDKYIKRVFLFHHIKIWIMPSIGFLQFVHIAQLDYII